MEDDKIIELFFERSQTAIYETKLKYDKYCRYIAYHVLNSESDTEECVNDVYLSVWNCIPPLKPKNFKAYIGSVTRNFALNRYDYNNAQKRSPELEYSLNEFSNLLQSRIAIDDEVILKDIINKFLASLNKKHRIIFMQRYWYFLSVKEIARGMKISENNVKVILYRTRDNFKNFLKKEGITI